MSQTAMLAGDEPAVGTIVVTRSVVKHTKLFELYGIPELPLGTTEVTAELTGVTTAVVNAIRRVVTDEIPGRALQVPADGFDIGLTTDVFMVPQFVNHRIHMIPLVPQIPAKKADELRLAVDVKNDGASVLNVYAGDMIVERGSMDEPLFNPTFRIAFLQPGKRLVIRGIYISTGYGRDDAAYNVGHRGGYTHLDIPQHTDADIREEGGVAVDLSGYTQSCMVASPRRHRLTMNFAATTPNRAEVLAVFSDGCANIKERLRRVVGALSRDAPTQHDIQFTVMSLKANAGVSAGLERGILQIPGETHTIGVLLCATALTVEPSLASISYVIKNDLVLTIRHTGDVAEVLARTCATAIKIFDVLQRGFTL